MFSATPYTLHIRMVSYLTSKEVAGVARVCVMMMGAAAINNHRDQALCQIVPPRITYLNHFDRVKDVLMRSATLLYQTRIPQLIHVGVGRVSYSLSFVPSACGDSTSFVLVSRDVNPVEAEAVLVMLQDDTFKMYWRTM